MAAQKKGDPVTSPYIYDSGGDYQGNHLSFVMNFDNQTRNLLDCLVHRDPGCVYAGILMGDPNSPSAIRVPATGDIPFGDTTVTKTQLIQLGFNKIEDILNFGQMCATF